VGPLARLFPLSLLARKNLSRARARTTLATLGIVVGVVAISSLGVFGVAFEQSQIDRVSDAATEAVVQPGPDADSETLAAADVAEVRRVTDAPVVGVRRGPATRVASLRESTTARVKTVERPRLLLEAETGRIPDAWRSGVLVGASLADDVDVAPGDQVTVGNESHRVAAVLADDRFGSVQPNDAVFRPPSGGPDGTYSFAVVKTDGPREANATAVALRSELNRRDRRYEVRDFQSAIERFRQQMNQINLFLLGIGAVSLFVAGVSILNVMLMSVVERRAEIGVLRAVGYGRLDVLQLILAEAALVGVVGATIGAAVSVGLGMVINAQFLGDPTAFSTEALWYVVAGFTFGVGASVVSGLYPAWLAASAPPVEALRD
jgi:putative ABC transport system permease protein